MGLVGQVDTEDAGQGGEHAVPMNLQARAASPSALPSKTRGTLRGLSVSRANRNLELGIAISIIVMLASLSFAVAGFGQSSIFKSMSLSAKITLLFVAGFSGSLASRLIGLKCFIAVFPNFSDSAASKTETTED